MPPQLLVRNLTSTPLYLKSVERYEALESVQHEGRRLFGGLKSNFTRQNSGSPTVPRLVESAQSFEKQDVNIHVDTFATQQTDIETTERAPNEVLRITLEAEGQKYRVDTPSPKNESQTLVPLVPDPKHEFTGVFHPQDSHLTFYDSANLDCWMQHLKDATPLSAVSIPGTHNSPTCHRALPSVRCQAVSPSQQLKNGVRFFDIRVQTVTPDSPILILVHSVFPISLTGPKYLRDLIEEVYEFLSENPSETLIISIKREGTGNGSDQDLGRILSTHYTRGADASRWYVDPAIPTLGQVRGKIVLMRRFAIDDSLHAEHSGRGWAIDAENWADNTPNDLHGAVCVQDFYEVLETENIEKKIGFARDHLDRAADCVCFLPGITTDKDNPVPPQPFYLNFLSASNFWKKGCWPERIAEKLNPAVVRRLCCEHAMATEGDGGTGIVVCDWVGDEGDWDIVRCIVGMNSKLMVREISL